MRLFLSAFAVVFLAGILVTIPSRAQEPASIDSRVTPYLENTTIVVARGDLAKLSPAVWGDWIQSNFGEAVPSSGLASAKAIGGAVIGALKAAGSSEVFVTASTLDIAQGGVAVLFPTDKPEDVQATLEPFLQSLPPQLSYSVHVGDRVVVVAQPVVWNRINKKPAAGQAELLKAISKSKSADLAVAIHIPDAMRRELAALAPEKLSDEEGLSISPQLLLKESKSLLVSLNAPPQVGVKLALATESSEGVQAAKQTLEQLLAKLSLSSKELKQESTDRSLNVETSEAWMLATLETLQAQVRAAASRSQESNNLKQIMLAMHMYHDQHRSFPPRETRGKDGKPLLSWRVHILPFIAQQALYSQFHLDEPWDSPHNLPLVEKMPQVFAYDAKLAAQGKTRYVLPLMEGSAWQGDGPPLSIRNITDGTSNTIAVVAAPMEQAVVWTKPEELPLTADSLQGKIFDDSESVLTGFFDGSIRALPNSIEASVLKAMLTHSGGEVVSY